MEIESVYAFIDESGTVGTKTGTRFLIVVVLSVSQPRVLELTIRRAIKKYGSKVASGEIKAADFEEAAILRLLQALAKEDLTVMAVVLDQHTIRREPKYVEEIYRRVTARAVRHLVQQSPRVEICLDKRYTNERQRHLLEKAIREEIADLPQVVLISQENSSSRKELQAADAVAWAFFQKYERDDSRFYDIIASKVVIEDVANGKDLLDD
ncbi:MAG: DUF3800 domain-containing protein [Chloroflexi bacterium]|nr:DUF3800 domain-containing protein [Chloroflexota bacterium]